MSDLDYDPSIAYCGCGELATYSSLSGVIVGGNGDFTPVYDLYCGKDECLDEDPGFPTNRNGDE